ncbi:MAG: alpha/beta fold hydrolase, partial [Candidatus Gastranaerophilaceae bacterium]
GKPTVLFCHGNAENITTTQIVAKQLAAKGNGVLMVEYEGYGKSQGASSENKLYQNAIDAAKFLNEKKGIPNNQIILMGHSLGGPIAAHTAASVSEENHFKGLILDSTVPSMADLVKSWIDKDYIAQIDEPKENYSIDRVSEDLKAGGGLFATEKFIPNIPKSTKILVVHSMNDNIVDETVGKKLMETAKTSRPDVDTFWEKSSFKSHQNYTCRMSKILDFISSPESNPVKRIWKYSKDKVLNTLINIKEAVYAIYDRTMRKS